MREVREEDKQEEAIISFEEEQEKTAKEVLKPKEVEVEPNYPQKKHTRDEVEPEEIDEKTDTENHTTGEEPLDDLTNLPIRKHRKIEHFWDGMDESNKQLAVYYANDFLANFQEDLQDGVGVINVTYKIIPLSNSNAITHIFIEYFDYEVLVEQPKAIEEIAPQEEENDIETEPVAPKSIFGRKK